MCLRYDPASEPLPISLSSPDSRIGRDQVVIRPWWGVDWGVADGVLLGEASARHPSRSARFCVDSDLDKTFRNNENHRTVSVMIRVKIVMCSMCNHRNVLDQISVHKRSARGSIPLESVRNPN